MTYRIGTRGSRLALAQANFVKARLATAFPDDAFELVTVTTMGDRDRDRPLASLDEPAPFARELERALLDGRIDLAVHSMKDLASACPDGLVLARAWPREDPRDALVLRNGGTSLDDLPIGATVATGSPRRTVLLRRLRPDLRFVPIRGNVETRLARLESDGLDALVLAAAGLKRLGLASRISAVLPVETCVPAANQGSLAIELRAADADLKRRLDALGDDDAEAIATAERGFLREIGADCHQPVGACAERTDGGITLRVAFARDESSPCAFATVTAPTPEAAVASAARAIRRQAAGCVTLIGAGPGDPDLITVKGLAAIREADCIIYDRLVSERLLDAAPPTCERIYAGKAGGHHTLPQREINALLARKALTHRNVVRLKGGDPFVFGRGGEEMDYLLARGVTCRVVPGVSAAIAAPGAFGIPVTHRGVARAFAVITAHAKDDAPLDIDFSRLTDPKETLVFLMGLSRLGDLAAALTAAGRAATTPAAVVSAGTTPDARCVAGTLADIAAKAARAALATPATVIVGDVVRERERLGFPLSGRRYLVPEIAGGEGRLAERLRRLGAEVDTVTVGRIEPIPNAVMAVDVAEATYLAFTSRNALAAFDDDLVAEVKRLGLKVAVLGRRTAAAATARGLKPDIIAEVETGAGLVNALSKVITPADWILHPTAEGIPPSLQALSRTCVYQAVAAYRNAPVAITRPVDLAACDGALFTCASSARRLLAHAPATRLTTAYAIGPTTAAALRELGVRDVITAAEPNLDALTAAVMV